jgi:hypothetical protein
MMQVDMMQMNGARAPLASMGGTIAETLPAVQSYLESMCVKSLQPLLAKDMRGLSAQVLGAPDVFDLHTIPSWTDSSTTCARRTSGVR